MAFVAITESRGLVKHPTDDTYMPMLDSITSHLISLSTSSQQSAAFSAVTQVVTLISTADCFFEIGSAPVATTASGAFLASGVYVTRPCDPSDKIAVINAS
jgi:hypothetical protein